MLWCSHHLMRLLGGLFAVVVDGKTYLPTYNKLVFLSGWLVTTFSSSSSSFEKAHMLRRYCTVHPLHPPQLCPDNAI